MQGTFSLHVSTVNFSDSNVGLGIILFLLKGCMFFSFSNNWNFCKEMVILKVLLSIFLMVEEYGPYLHYET